MSTPIKPLGDRVVAVREAAQEKTASGLYLPDNAKKQSQVAVVEAVGPEVKSIKKGDRILYAEFSEVKRTIDQTEFLIVKEEDILGIL